MSKEVGLAPVSFRLSAEERDLVVQAAQLLNKSVSSFVRDLVTQGAAKVVEANRSILIAQRRAEIERLQRELEHELTK